MVDWKGRMSNIPRTKHEEPIHVPLNDVAVASFGVVQVEALGQGVCFQSVIQAKPEWESRDGVSCGTDCGFNWRGKALRRRDGMQIWIRAKAAPRGASVASKHRHSHEENGSEPATSRVGLL
jgi:hypothetical protein